MRSELHDEVKAFVEQVDVVAVELDGHGGLLEGGVDPGARAVRHFEVEREPGSPQHRTEKRFNLWLQRCDGPVGLAHELIFRLLGLALAAHLQIQLRLGQPVDEPLLGKTYQITGQPV